MFVQNLVQKNGTDAETGADFCQPKLNLYHFDTVIAL
jgi:hypothetical protein